MLLRLFVLLEDLVVDFADLGLALGLKFDVALLKSDLRGHV